MANKTFYLALVLLLVSWQAYGQQTDVSFRNTTSSTFNIDITQTGTVNLQSPSDWEQLESIQNPWIEETAIFSTMRDSATIPLGDTVHFDIALQADADTITIQLRLVGVAGGSSMQYTVAGNGFTQPWYSDDNFHQLQTTVGTEDVIIKFKADSDASMNANILLTIHHNPIYTIDADDFQDPNTLNVMTYNVQMLPLGISGLPLAAERGALMPQEFSPYQDVIIFQEVFDEEPRLDYLIPALKDEGFDYVTTVLNPAPSPTSIPSNGGVMIASRWPIEYDDDFDFSKCGQAAQDCLAAKGIKYARINKLGKKYHVFGTHMDAGSGTDDIEAKNSQMGEMRDFIASQNIPSSEAVVFGGDFNVSPIAGNRLYLNYIDSIQPVIPNAIGYHSSTLSTTWGQIIDHVWGSSRHLIPLVATNEVITFRPLYEELWELGEFSDHRPSLGRFVYPDINATSNKAVHCPGDSMILTVSSNNAISYQWQKDGQDIQGATDSIYVLTNVSESDTGIYQCVVGYQQVFGNTGDTLNPLFFPFGPDTITANCAFSLGLRKVDSVLCLVGIDAVNAPRQLQVYPNPATSVVTINWKAYTGEANITLYNAIGKALQHHNLRGVNQYQLNTQHLPEGLYIITLEVDQQIYSSKLLVTP